jgi:hypothetical protein
MTSGFLGGSDTSATRTLRLRPALSARAAVRVEEAALLGEQRAPTLATLDPSHTHRLLFDQRLGGTAKTGGASGIAAPSCRGSDAPKWTPPGPLITTWP